ncbi:hypothetical protein L7F22_012121 [Adiantum nelumboides]|nr:hypothetical protein [Adiantum nelumboides]
MNSQWSMMIICGLCFICGIMMLKKALLSKLLQTLMTLMKQKSQPPGPWGWPIVGNLFQLSPEPYKDFMKLHQKYGPLVRLKLGSVNIVTTFHPELIKEMICNKDEIFANRPQTIGVQHLAYGGRDIALAPYGPHWKNMRRICMEYLLTTRRLESYQKHRTEEAKFMVHQIMENVKEGKRIMVRDVLGSFSMNIMTQMLLSKRFFGSKDAGPEQSAEFLHITHQVFWLLGLFNIADYLPFLRWFDLQGYEQLMRQVEKRMDAFHSKILHEHRLEHELRGDRPRDRPDDFVDILLTLPGHNGEDHLDDIEMKALIQDMIAAAIDTSSVTSEWAMSEIMRNPDILKRAQEELDRVVGQQRNVEEADLVHLSYLRSIVKETFRLHPPGPFLITHEALKDTEVAGYHIPKKTQLFVNTYALGRSPDLWTDKVEQFWPDRWIEEQVEIRDEKFRILPFSAGRRRCPGAPLGQCMVLLALATLLHSFDWSLPPPLKPENLNMAEAFGLTLPRAEPLVAMAKPRLPLHIYY